MKRVIPIVALIFCLLMVMLSPQVMQAAQTAVSLWLNLLLPTLFPFFCCISFLERTGAIHMLARLFNPLAKKMGTSSYMLPLLFLSALSGYPSGPRSCGMLLENGLLSHEEAELLASVCHLCSPMFLAGAVANGMFGNMQVLMPLAVGHYGGAVIVAFMARLLFPIKRPSHPVAHNTRQGEPLMHVLPSVIASGMRDMIRVGGTVIFFFVIGNVLANVGILSIIGRPIDFLLPTTASIPASQGILLGLLEMTGGCAMLTQAGLRLQTTVGICAFLISFGGLSVFVQAAAFIRMEHPLRYLGIKLLHAATAAAIAYMLFPKTAGALNVFSPNHGAYLENALSGMTILFSCALGVGAAFLLALLTARRKPIKR